MLKRTAIALLLLATVSVLPAHAQTSVAASSPVSLSDNASQDTTEAVDAEAPADEGSTAKDTSEGGDVDRINGKYLKGYVVDTARIVASPLSWDGNDWLKAGLVVGGTGALFLADRPVKNFTQRHRSSVTDGFSSFGNAFGTYYYMVPALGSFYLYGSLTDDHKAKRTALLALESFTITGALTSTIKTLASRHRPDCGHPPNTWDGPSWSSQNVSFASGHTALAFSVATVVADQYQENKYVAPIAYSLASLTGLARIYTNQHWSSDVFFGGALGYFVSKAILSFHKEDNDKEGKKKKSRTRLTLVPELDKSLTGMSMKYEF